MNNDQSFHNYLQVQAWIVSDEVCIQWFAWSKYFSRNRSCYSSCSLSTRFKNSMNIMCFSFSCFRLFGFLTLKYFGFYIGWRSLTLLHLARAKFDPTYMSNNRKSHSDTLSNFFLIFTLQAPGRARPPLAIWRQWRKKGPDRMAHRMDRMAPSTVWTVWCPQQPSLLHLKHMNKKKFHLICANLLDKIVLYNYV